VTHFNEQAGFPEYALVPGLRVKLEAVSTTLDAAVTGVTSTRFAIYGYDETPGDDLLDEVPRWTPDEVIESV
jgi:hypothetical protein